MSNLFEEQKEMPTRKKVGIFFYSNLKYEPGLYVLLNSILEFNPEIKNTCDFILGYTDELPKRTMKYFDKVFKIDKEEYSKIRFDGPTRKKYQESFYKLEFFDIDGYDKVVMIESDILCLGDISDLISDKYSTYPIYGAKHMGCLSYCISPSVLILNKTGIWKNLFNKSDLIKESEKVMYTGDDNLLNSWIKTNKIHYGVIPPVYNYVLAWPAHVEMGLRDIRLLHFGRKPWINYVERDGYHKLWQQYWRRYGGP